MRDSDLDVLLRRALKREGAPHARLVEQVTYQWIKKEEEEMNKAARISIKTIALAAVLVAVLAGSALAALNLLKPGEVAKRAGDIALSAAFESKDALMIDETLTSGDYALTLMGLVSGRDLSDLPFTGEGVLPERSYAVVAIRRADGGSVTTEESASLYMSPLVKGLKPWMVNINTMNGAYSEIAKDGVVYRIVECDDVAMFADKDLYLCVSDTVAFSRDAFDYSNETGEISPRADYKGVNALFKLPMDPSKADPAKAAEYLKQIRYDDAPSDTESMVTPAPGESVPELTITKDK
jgi:hypothetical protein